MPSGNFVKEIFDALEGDVLHYRNVHVERKFLVEAFRINVRVSGNLSALP